jgi:hypothetical protein
VALSRATGRPRAPQSFLSCMPPRNGRIRESGRTWVLESVAPGGPEHPEAIGWSGRVRTDGVGAALVHAWSGW